MIIFCLYLAGALIYLMWLLVSLRPPVREKDGRFPEGLVLLYVTILVGSTLLWPSLIILTIGYELID